MLIVNYIWNCSHMLPLRHVDHIRSHAITSNFSKMNLRGVVCGALSWLFPTFLIPKKDGRVRLVTDFRELNKLICCKVYNFPKIQDILTKCTGFKYFSKLDISMQYYAFELDDSSKELCTICTPFGNY